MSERDINRWDATICPQSSRPQPWTLGSGGSWDMFKIAAIPDSMLAELAQRYQYAGTPWNCRSMPLSDSDREYMYLLYYSMQGLVARMRLGEMVISQALDLLKRCGTDVTEADRATDDEWIRVEATLRTFMAGKFEQLTDDKEQAP